MKSLSFNNGDQMPIIGLGTWKSEPGTVGKVIRQAINLGYRHFDCSPFYGNEPEIGQALKEAILEGEVSRRDLWITSKLWSNAHEPKRVESALQQTLDSLQLDYLDLYLMHWPVAIKAGVDYPSKPEDFLSLKEVPLIDTWRAMEVCVDKELCRHIGVSNFSAQKVWNLKEEARIQPEMNQVEMHPCLQQAELVAFCQDEGVHITAYSPLGSSDRPDRVKSEADPNLLENKVIKSIAREADISPAQVLLAWSVHRNVAAIPKSSNPERLAQNIQSASIVLTNEAVEQINQLDQHYRLIAGNGWTIDGSPYTQASLWDE